MQPCQKGSVLTDCSVTPHKLLPAILEPQGAKYGEFSFHGVLKCNLEKEILAHELLFRFFNVLRQLEDAQGLLIKPCHQAEFL